MKAKKWMNKRRFSIRGKLHKMLKCMRSGEQFRVEDIPHSSDSLATRDYSASEYSSRTGEVELETKVDNSNIEEAESSLRESGYLNYEVSCIYSFAFLLGFFDMFSCIVSLAT